MKPCIHRQPFSDTEIICLNIAQLKHPGVVPNSVCEICPYVTESPIRGAGDVVAAGTRFTGIKALVEKSINSDCGCAERQDKLNDILPNPNRISNDRWTVVLTTAPRTNPTLTSCISSIRKAGWEPTVFAEPGSLDIPNVSYRWNKERLGVWFNWKRSMQWALDQGKEFILSIQDDSLFHPDSREFVESIMWPTGRTGFISLYTPKHYSMDKSRNWKKTGVNRIKTGSLWGACALVMHRNVVKMMLEHPICTEWYGVLPHAGTLKDKKEKIKHRLENPHTIQNSDTAIGKLINALNLDMFFIDPSPVTHISTHSAIGHGDNSGKRNCIRCADHTKPLVDQVFPNR